MTREKGIQMVKKHDHILSNDLDHWLNYVNMKKIDFFKIGDKFRIKKKKCGLLKKINGTKKYLGRDILLWRCLFK